MPRLDPPVAVRAWDPHLQRHVEGWATWWEGERVNVRWSAGPGMTHLTGHDAGDVERLDRDPAPNATAVQSATALDAVIGT